MKASHFASLLLLAAAATFACSDDDDGTQGPNEQAGTSSVGGSSGGTPNGAGSAGKAGNTGNGGSSDAAGKSGSTGGDDAGGGGGPDASGGTQSEGGTPSSEGGAGLGGLGIGGEPSSGGAAGAGGERGEARLEIIGTWDNNYGGTEVISATHWGSATIAAYDNEDNAVYTQLPANDQYNPSKFTKIVYTEPTNDSFYYCWVVFSANTLSDAQSSTLTADAATPESGGCGGFPWTKATKQP